MITKILRKLDFTFFQYDENLVFKQFYFRCVI